MTKSTNNRKIDPNTASIDDLARLPGIGKVLAERIIAQRPLESSESLKKVSGISADMLEKIRPHLAFDRDAVGAEGEGEAPADVSEQEMEPEPGPEPEPEPGGVETLKVPGAVPAVQTAPAPATRWQAVWIAAAAGLFSFLLGLAVTFGLLAALNGGLRYANPGSVADARVQIEALEETADTLETEIAVLRARVDGFEALGGRVTALEDTGADLADQVEVLDAAVDGFADRVDEIDGRMSQVETETENFQGFLDGLYELLADFAGTGTTGDE